MQKRIEKKKTFLIVTNKKDHPLITFSLFSLKSTSEQAHHNICKNIIKFKLKQIELTRDFTKPLPSRKQTFTHMEPKKSQRFVLMRGIMLALCQE